MSLQSLIQQIKNATLPGENTALRVGSAFEQMDTAKRNIIDSLSTSQTLDLINEVKLLATSGAVFIGSITPATTIPPSGNLWGFAEAGTYPNAGDLVVTAGSLGILSRANNVWSKIEVTIPVNPPVTASFEEDNAVNPQGGKQINEWLFGSDVVETGDTTAITMMDMTTTAFSNTSITYWMYKYVVPYPHSILSEFKINITAAGDLRIKRYKKTGSGPSALLTFQEQKTYVVAAGLNTINILTQPDKSGNINNLWQWDSDDLIAIYCAGGLKGTEVASPLLGIYGNGSAPSDTTNNFTVSTLTDVPDAGVLLSVKFTELVSSVTPGKVVNEIDPNNPNGIPNIKAVMDYVNGNDLNQLDEIIMIPSVGQSLAGGTDGGASTFTSPVDIAFTTGNVNSNVQDMNGGYVEMFKEMAKHNDYALPAGFKIMTSVAYLGGTCITDLSKGTATYNTLLSQVQTAKNTAESLGKTFSVPAFCWTQGEEDYRAGGSNGINYNTGKYIPTEYATKLIKLVDDLNTDIKAITGQNIDVKCVMYQVASHNAYGRFPRIALEQLKAAKLDKRIILAKTMYDVDYNVADNVHAPNKTYRNMGNYYGIALFDAIVKGGHNLPIYPIKNTLVGNSMYVQFHVPVKPLVFDEVAVAPLSDGKKGFNLVTVINEYTTSATIAAAATTITNVELVSADTVKLTLSGTPTTGTRLTYGVNGLGWNIINGDMLSGARSSGRVNGARGNLRDSQTLFNPVSDYFNLYNWSTIFEIIL